MHVVTWTAYKRIVGAIVLLLVYHSLSIDDFNVIGKRFKLSLIYIFRMSVKYSGAGCRNRNFAIYPNKNDKKLMFEKLFLQFQTY